MLFGTLTEYIQSPWYAMEVLLGLGYMVYCMKTYKD